MKTQKSPKWNTQNQTRKSTYKPNPYGWGIWDGWATRERREVKPVKGQSNTKNS